MNLRRHLTALLLLLPLSALAIPYAATEENARDILPGKDYIVLAAPLPTTTGKQIEVREFFWYGCPHCFEMERHVAAWLQKKPEDVEFVLTPADSLCNVELSAVLNDTPPAVVCRMEKRAPKATMTTSTRMIISLCSRRNFILLPDCGELTGRQYLCSGNYGNHVIRTAP